MIMPMVRMAMLMLLRPIAAQECPPDTPQAFTNSYDGLEECNAFHDTMSEYFPNLCSMTVSDLQTNLADFPNLLSGVDGASTIATICPTTCQLDGCIAGGAAALDNGCTGGEDLPQAFAGSYDGMEECGAFLSNMGTYFGGVSVLCGYTVDSLRSAFDIPDLLAVVDDTSTLLNTICGASCCSLAIADAPPPAAPGCSDVPGLFADLLTPNDEPLGRPDCAEFVPMIGGAVICGYSLSGMVMYQVGLGTISSASAQEFTSAHPADMFFDMCGCTCSSLGFDPSTISPPAPRMPPAAPGCTDTPGAFSNLTSDGGTPFLQTECAQLIPVELETRFCGNYIEDIVEVMVQRGVVDPGAPESLTVHGPLWQVCGCACDSNGFDTSKLRRALPPPGLEAMRRCCVGYTIRIGVAKSDQPPVYNVKAGETVGTYRYSGFMKAMLEQLSSVMGFDFELVPTDGPMEAFFAVVAPQGESLNVFGKFPGGSLDAAVFSSADMKRSCWSGSVRNALQMVDSAPCFWDFESATTSPFSQTSMPAPEYYNTSFRSTTAFYSSSYSGLLKYDEPLPSPWRLFEPFAGETWMITFILLGSTAVLMSLVECIYPSHAPSRGSLGCSGIEQETKNVVNGAYHTLAACFGGEDFEWVTWPLRLLRLGLLLLVLVLASTCALLSNRHASGQAQSPPQLAILPSCHLAGGRSSSAPLLRPPRMLATRTHARHAYACARHAYAHARHASPPRMPATRSSAHGAMPSMRAPRLTLRPDTANLASFFTRSGGVTYGPADMSELPASTPCFWHRYLFHDLEHQFFKEDVVADAPPGTGTNPTTRDNNFFMDPNLLPDGASYCMESLANQRSDIYVEDKNLLHLLHLENCATTREAGFMSVANVEWFFLTSGNSDFGKELQVNLTKAISLFRNTGAYQELQKKYFSAGDTCSAESEDDELKPVSIAQMLGLYYLWAILSGAGVLLAFVLALWARIRAWQVQRAKSDAKPKGKGLVADRGSFSSSAVATVHAVAAGIGEAVDVSAGPLDESSLAQAMQGKTDGELTRMLVLQIASLQKDITAIKSATSPEALSAALSTARPSNSVNSVVREAIRERAEPPTARGTSEEVQEGSWKEGSSTTAHSHVRLVRRRSKSRSKGAGSCYAGSCCGEADTYSGGSASCDAHDSDQPGVVGIAAPIDPDVSMRL